MKASFYLSAILILATSSANAQQNLILNGGFEAHAKQTCLECNTLYGQYSSLVFNWDNGGWACWLCDKEYKQYSDEKRRKSCPLDRILPKEGKSMIDMIYHPGINGIHGGASHLTARSTQVLQVGNLYEVSCWIFIDSVPKADPDWARHIGIALLPQKIAFRNLSGTQKIPAIYVDKVIYNKWFKAKWRIRPLCTSNYLMIGVFRNDHWPLSQSYAPVHYYLDNVVLTELPSKSAIQDSSIYYCSRYDPQTNSDLLPRMDNITFRYATDSFKLTPMHKTVLDSFVSFAKKYPRVVFELAGHTDSIGSDNIVLSEHRVQEVLQYLLDTHNLSGLRFIPIHLGSQRPVAPNNTEAGRALNRRVEIRQSEVALHMMIYRSALKAAKEHQYSEVFSYLNRWLKTGQSGIILLFDPRFECLKKDKRWVVLERKIRDSYNNLKYPEYAFKIDSLRMEDIKVLGELPMALNGITGDLQDWNNLSVYLTRMPNIVVEQKSREHFSALLPILKEVGLPKRSEFADASESALALLLHSYDTLAYVSWLPILKKTCEEGEAPWIAYALLYDECQIIANKPQRYATKNKRLPNGTYYLLPWEGDENTINEHRAKIGLPLLSENIIEAMNNE